MPDLCRIATAMAVAVVAWGCAADEVDPPAGPPTGPATSQGPTEQSPTEQSPTEIGTGAAAPTPAPLPTVHHAPRGDFAVGRADVVLVDPDRGTDATDRTPARADRTIQVRILYPAAAAPGSPVADDAEVAAGRFPVLVFSHGLGGNAAAYEEVVGPVAAQGYVVVMPTYPLSRAPIGSFVDVVNQPADVSFVLDSLASMSQAWAGAMDLDRVAAGGHSLGAITSLAVTYGDGLKDRRIDAMIGFAGARFDLDKRGFQDREPKPMLLVHGAQDPTLPLSGSERIFAQARGPAGLLVFPDAGHVDFFVGAQGRLLIEATVAFLDAYLKGERRAWARLPSRVADTGVGQWRQRNGG